MQYGKAAVAVYRTHAQPLTGLTPIPESAFTGRPNTLFAVELEVKVLGDNFLAAYTEGDNENVVATDSMKNFVHEMALQFQGATLEAFFHFLGRRFLATYSQMQSVRISGRELPFTAAPVPDEAGGFGASGVLFGRLRDDYACASLEIGRPEISRDGRSSDENSPDGAGHGVVAHRCGREALQLIKITGSAFTRFVRDAHTTLPERVDRPLFIYLDVFWRYGDVHDAVAEDLRRYVAAEQVRDVVQATFHTFVSMSIQHLVHEMGTRLLARFPQLAEVSFEAQNRLWDTATVSEGERDASAPKVYFDPRPPYGRIALTLARDP